MRNSIGQLAKRIAIMHAVVKRATVKRAAAKPAPAKRMAIKRIAAKRIVVKHIAVPCNARRLCKPQFRQPGQPRAIAASGLHRSWLGLARAFLINSNATASRLIFTRPLTGQ